MLRTKNLITDIKEIPSTWIFEHYLTLPEALMGQDIKINSIFTDKDKIPSFFIYFCRFSNSYKFKDFSTGKQGDGIELVKELFSLPKRYDAGYKIINDYNEFICNRDVHKPSVFSITTRYKVQSFKLRSWNEVDSKYWSQYKIGTDLLNKYNVKPIEYFTLAKANQTNILTIQNTTMYAYFTKDEELYKIYQPLVKENKFLKVKSHIQGLDQLTYSVPYLVICSSLKDIMAFNKMNFKNVEAIAPDSENTILSETNIKKFKSQYNTLCTLFDNDEAGINAMHKYKKLYDIPMVHYKIEKDISDSVKVHGLLNTQEILGPLLRKVLKS